jgi:RNA polymerase sigma factor (sigma-70 family)
MEDHEDISQLRIDPKAWDRQDVWQKLWGTAVMKASERLNRVSPNQAEDIAIESITTVIEELPRYPEIRTLGGLRAFTATVASRLAASHLRRLWASKRRWRDENDIDDSDESPRAPVTPESERKRWKKCTAQSGENAQADKAQSSPADDLQIKDSTRVITSILEKLKPEKRALLYDFYLHGLKHKEIAAKHNMPVGNVGNYIQRALKEVNECLQDYPKLRDEICLLVGFNILLLLLFWS